jgi:hypothetical protein
MTGQRLRAFCMSQISQDTLRETMTESESSSELRKCLKTQPRPNGGKFGAIPKRGTSVTNTTRQMLDKQGASVRKLHQARPQREQFPLCIKTGDRKNGSNSTNSTRAIRE